MRKIPHHCNMYFLVMPHRQHHRNTHNYLRGRPLGRWFPATCAEECNAASSRIRFPSILQSTIGSSKWRRGETCWAPLFVTRTPMKYNKITPPKYAPSQFRRHLKKWGYYFGFLIFGWKNQIPQTEIAHVFNYFRSRFLQLAPIFSEIVAGNKCM